MGQSQERPIAAPDHFAALFFFDRGKGEIEMEQREEMQRRIPRRNVMPEEGRIHAVSTRRSASASLAAVRAASRVAPVVSTIAADGLLSPAGGMMSPGLAVTMRSATPETLRAFSTPLTAVTRPGFGNA